MLPAAGSSDNPDLLPGGDAEGEVVEDGLPVDVLEAHVLEVDGGCLRVHLQGLRCGFLLEMEQVCCRQTLIDMNPKLL